MSTLAFIGLGIMGGPMARHLVEAGYRVIGFNRSSDPVERLAAAGGEGATSVADAVRDAEVTITVVPDSPDVERASRSARMEFTPTRGRDRSTSTCPPSDPMLPPGSLRLARQRGYA